METQTTTHTPGPWWIQNNHPEYSPPEILHIYANDGSPFPCDLATLWGGGKEYSEELQANAQLIAAAPDLLNALKELVANMPSNYPGPLDKFVDLIYKAEAK